MSGGSGGLRYSVRPAFILEPKKNMKFSILIIAILALAFSAYSQTTNVSGGVSGLAPTNALQAIGVSPAGQNAITALENVFVDVGPYITNDVANIQAGLLYK